MFDSQAHYIANKDGRVDVCRDSSLGGSYSGVEPMGLLWSMKPAPGQRKGLRLFKTNVTKPYNVVLNCFDGHVIPHEGRLQPLSSGTFQKWHMVDGVKRIPVKEGRIRATLFIPPGDGPFPGTCYEPRSLSCSQSSLMAAERKKRDRVLALRSIKPRFNCSSLLNLSDVTELSRS